MITIKDIESVLALFTEEEKENMMVLGNTVYVNFSNDFDASDKADWIVGILGEGSQIDYYEWEDIRIGAYKVKSENLDFWLSFGFALKGEIK